MRISKTRLGIQKQDLGNLLWTILAVIFIFGMVIQPKNTYDGAVNGLTAWWNIVFPSLLPFFIFSEILMRLGMVRFIGNLLEPVMRPLFNVPGAGAFVMVIGFTSGFPIGSMVTAQLRQQGLCTKNEAERLMSFTNNSSPLFMLTAVAVGMFGKPEFGLIIATAHYSANLTLGILLRFVSLKKLPPRNNNLSAAWSLRSALKVLLEHQRTDKQSLGKLLGESVTSSITKLLNIGGFIILFAVIIKLLSAAGVIQWLSDILSLFLIPLGISSDILPALASGFFEMTIGTKTAAESTASELQKLIAVAMILGWSGLSIHAQVASMIAKTDIKMKLFIITRLLHATLASIFTVLIYKTTVSYNTSVSVPVISPVMTNFYFSPWKVFCSSCSTLVYSLSLLFVLSLCCLTWSIIKGYVNRYL